MLKPETKATIAVPFCTVVTHEPCLRFRQEDVERDKQVSFIFRVCGGIHFLDGALEGTKQGEKVGDWVWSTLTSKPVETAPTKETSKQIAGN